MLLGGDLNIAHAENDIHNPVANKKSSGFLPHERAWFGDALLGAGWRDEQREAAGDAKGPYSWWSNRGRARAPRPRLADRLPAEQPPRREARRVTATHTDREAGLRCSDHAPVSIDLRVRDADRFRPGVL